MNEFWFYGRALEVPKLVESEKGNKYCNLLVEVERNYTSTDNGPSADIFKLVSFKAVAEDLCNNVKKNQHLLIRGRLQANNYNRDNGEQGYRSELVGERYEYL